MGVRLRSTSARLALFVAALAATGCSGSAAAPSGSGSPAATTASPPSAPSGSALDLAVAPAGPPVAPDIIVVLVDDLGYIPDDRVLARLPNIRRVFIEGGLRFTRMYDETPLCCPARATLLSGKHTLHHGVITNDGDPFDPTTTLATALDGAGYQTLLMGKYLNDYEGTRTPPGWDRVMMRERNVGAHFTIDGEAVDYEGMHFDDALRAQAATWVAEASTDSPVFALISPRAPHRHPQRCERGDRGCQYLPLVMDEDVGAEACAGVEPFRPPSYSVADDGRRAVPWSMPDFPDGWPLVTICESLMVVDRMVGELVEAQAARQRPGTFVFLSDNGMAWGQKAFPQKHVPPATRLPFYLAGPGIEPGETDALLSNVDLGPTLAALGGATLPSDGASFLPLDEATASAASTADREILEVMPADPAGFYDGWSAVRTPDLRYIRWDSGVRELYDVIADEWELENLVEERAEDAERLDARLDALLEASRG